MDPPNAGQRRALASTELAPVAGSRPAGGQPRAPLAPERTQACRPLAPPGAAKPRGAVRLDTPVSVSNIL